MLYFVWSEAAYTLETELVICDVPVIRLSVNDEARQLIQMKSISILKHKHTFTKIIYLDRINWSRLYH